MFTYRSIHPEKDIETARHPVQTPTHHRQNSNADRLERMNQAPAPSQTINTSQQDPFDLAYPYIVRQLYSKTTNFSAFFSTLRSTTSGLTPAQAAKVVGEMMPSIQRSVNLLNLTSHDADGGQFTKELSSNSAQIRKQFDGAVSNLSSVLQKISNSPQGMTYAESISLQISRLISKSNDIGRWDEALGNTLVNGEFQTIEKVKNGKDVDPTLLGQGSTFLASKVVSLLATGEAIGFGTSADKNKANDILENIQKSASLLRKANETLTERTDADNTLLKINIQNWAAFGSEEQVKKAIEAEKQSHGTFDQLEAMAGHTLQIFDELDQLTRTLPTTEFQAKLKYEIFKYQETFSQSVELTNSGTEYYEEMINRWQLQKKKDNKNGFIDNIIENASDITKNGKKSIEVLANLYLKNEIASLYDAAIKGNNGRASNIMNQLVQKSAKLGINQEDLDGLAKSFNELQSTNNLPAALSDFKAKANKISAFHSSTHIGTTLNLLGLGLSIANLVQNFPDKNEADLRKMIQTSSDAVGVGKAGLKLLSSNAVWKETLSKNLDSMGNKLNVASLLFGVKDVVSSVKEKDWAGVAIGSMGVLNGALGLMGLGGAAFAVGLAAMAISFQISRVEASNILETKHTEAFLQELGIPQEVAHHLRNADKDGRSIGSALQALMEFTKTDPNTFLNSLTKLSPSQAKDLAEACHGVDPNKNGQLPQTDEFALYAGYTYDELEEKGVLKGQRNNAQIIDDYTRPHSIQGLRNFIKRTGIPLAL